MGDFVISDEDPLIRKIRKDEFPIGFVASGGFQNEYVAGDRVPIEGLVDSFGRMLKTIEINGILYVKGYRANEKFRRYN